MSAESLSGEALHDYWDGFYASRAAAAVPEDCSAFATWVAERLGPEVTLVEFGFGTARDSLFFARRGHRVLGFDFAESAVERASGRAVAGEYDAEFDVLDLYDQPGTVRVAESLREIEPLVVYGRFLLHSLEEAGRDNLFDLAATALAGGGELLVEFRTGLDAGHEHLFGDDHYRAYLDPDEVVERIERRGGSIIHREQGHGMAIYKSEDPHVARIAARFGSVAG